MFRSSIYKKKKKKKEKKKKKWKIEILLKTSILHNSNHWKQNSN